MIRGIGIDIIELERIQKAVFRKNKFIDRILTPNEKTRYESLMQEKRKMEFLAGRFAAKEAFAKATGQGIGKLSFKHIEILPGASGAPMAKVPGHDPEKIFVSISHSKQYAVAQVIITQ